MSWNHAVHEPNAEGEWRSSGRRAALVAGLLFIVADVAGFAGDALLRSFSGPDYLTQLYAHGGMAAAGVLAKVIGALACVGIALALYQVLKRVSQGLALGSVVFRTLEAAFYMIGAMSLLALLKLSERFAAAGVADQVSIQAIGDALLSLRVYAAPLLGVLAFCVGGFLYNVLFFRARLLPRWLSGSGMLAALALAAACLLSLFSGNRITSYIPLAFPIFVQELVLAGWLIAKGFDMTAMAAGPVRHRADLPGAAPSPVPGSAR